MTELQRALFEILLELREILGGNAARKNLQGKNTPGDYLKMMLHWLGDKLNAPPLREGVPWKPTRPPTDVMMGKLMRAAVKSVEFKGSANELAEVIRTQTLIKGFPNTEGVLCANPNDEAWVNFFRKLLRLAVPAEGHGPEEKDRPPWLVLPKRRWRPGVDQPGLLLRAENEIVPFQGRNSEMQDLQLWCEDEDPFAMRCYIGPGGMGKTRLALKICRQMQNFGWLSGSVKFDRLPRDAMGLRQMPRLRAPALLVVDYAERHREALLDFIYWGASKGRHKVRVLMLARMAGEWWQLAHDDAQPDDELENAFSEDPIELSPLALTLEERKAAFDHASEAFARSLGKPRPNEKPPKLDAPYFTKILWVHMAALLAINGRHVTGEYAILDEVLRHERRYWRKLGETFKIPAPLLRLLGRAVCVFTANQGARDGHEAVNILRGIPGFGNETDAILESISTLLHECFPGASWIEPLQPDRLGGRLVELETDRNRAILTDFIHEE